MIENISFYDDAKLGTDLTAEADWKRRGLYIGPQVNDTRFYCYVTSDNYSFFSFFFCIV